MIAAASLSYLSISLNRLSLALVTSADSFEGGENATFGTFFNVSPKPGQD